MVYRKKVYKRKRPTRYAPKRRRYARVSNMRMVKVHNFTRWWTAPSINLEVLPFPANTFTVVPFAFSFALNQLPNFAEFTALYDHYRIVKVKVMLFPSFNVSFADGLSTNTTASDLGRVWSCIDYDDDNAFAPNLTGLNDMRQRKNAKVTRGSKIHKRYFTPSVLQVVADSGGTNAVAPKFKQWLSVTDDTVPHLGLKGIYENGMVNAAPAGELIGYLRAECKFYIQCKNVK